MGWLRGTAPSEAARVLALTPWAAGLAVMRSLGRVGVRVFGLVQRAPSPARWSRHCAGLLPIGEGGRPTGDPRRTLDDLLAAGRRLGEGTVLVAGTDDWTLFVAEHAEPLRAVFRLQVPAFDLVRDLTSKEGQGRVAAGQGLSVPHLVTPRDAAHAAELAGQLRYPVMVKPNRRRLDVVDKAIAEGPASLLHHYRALEESPTAPNVTFQEYVPGEDADDWLLNAYFDARSCCLFAHTGRKVRQHPAHLGHCSMGVSEHNPTIVEAGVRMLAAVGYRGPVELGFRFDRRDGRYHLLDVNPRLGGTFRLCVDARGTDVARAMYWDLVGRPVDCAPPREGRVWMREHEELVAFRRYRQAGELSLWGWLRSLARVDEAAAFSVRDPLPLVSVLTMIARQTVIGR
jgi:D-aspartate ligase